MSVNRKADERNVRILISVASLFVGIALAFGVIKGVGKDTSPETNTDQVAVVTKAVLAAIDQREQDQRKVQAQAVLQEYAAAPEQSDKHLYGAPGARFTLVEWSDFECPYCKRFHSTPKSVVDASGGKVNWQFKNMPLSFHNPVAQSAAETAECVSEIGGNRAFWAFTSEWYRSTSTGGQGVADVTTLIERLGLDSDEISACASSGKMRDRIARDVEQAKRLNVSGTPATFVVDNQTGKSVMVGGAQPAQALQSAIAKLESSGGEAGTNSSSSPAGS